ncbi:hypothetical protein KY339_03880 [Candidatus Woesearchaeota archaeon]|nr:hypothetical protein [Candidatus Woesearchaeota archaeon]
MSEKSLEKRILGYLGANAVAAGLAAVLAFYTPNDAEARERNTPKLGMKQVDYKTLAKKAEKLNEEKKYQEVIRLLSPYENEAKDAMFFNELGVAYSRSKKIRESYDALMKGYELNPDHKPTLYNLALISYRNKEYEVCIKVGQEYLNKEKDSVKKINIVKRFVGASKEKISNGK